VEQLQREYLALPKPTALLITPEDRQRILRLAQNIPAVWHAPTTMQAERKQLVRYLIKDVTLTKREMVIEVRIRWRTEALTEVTVPRPKVVADARRTDAQVVARVRELAPTHTATQIALLLNEAGLHPGLGGSFTASKVDWIRAAYDIPLDCPRSAGILSQRATRRWTLLSPGGSGTAECECLDYCGLVQLRAVRECTRRHPWASVDYAHTGDHRRAPQAGSASLETTGFSSTRAKYATVKPGWIGSADPPWQHNPESFP